MLKVIVTTLSLICLALVVSISTQADENLIQYPANYRHWTHIKSMVIQEGHPLHASFGGIHHIYANDKALQGYRSGKFPDGAIIIFDLLELTDSKNTITEGNRKVLGVMLKDSTKYSLTAGWGFEGFGTGDPENRVVGENYEEACFACHISQNNNDYVFSEWRD